MNARGSGTLRLVAGLALFAVAAGVAMGLWQARAVRPPLARPETPLPSLLPTVTVEIPQPEHADPDADGIKIATFLGNETRSF